MTTPTDLAALPGPASMARLDPYVGGYTDDCARVDALATISCGTRGESSGDKPGIPRASRPGDARQLHLHDPQNLAPGLAAALEAGGHRSLLIAFPLDDPREFIIQRFTRYSASRLEVYGDAASLTVIDRATSEHRRVPAGTPEYEVLVRTCKADTRIYFCLAEYGPDGPEVVFPDGVGVYAIRTTSRHSVQSILGSLGYTARFTHDRLAGIPFTLEVDHREVAGPDGSKRTIPVLRITTKPPAGARLSSRTFRELAASGLREGELLMLPAPTAPELADFELAGPAVVEEPTDAEIAMLEQGGLCDYPHANRAWHAAARGTKYATDKGRAEFLKTYTNGQFDSLHDFLEQASEGQVDALLAALSDAVVTSRGLRPRADRYAEIFGTEAELDTAADRGAPKEPMITSTNAKLYQDFKGLSDRAARLSIVHDLPAVPISEAELRRLGKELQDLVIAAEADAKQSAGAPR